MQSTAVVTGAGRGFGREIARRLVARGYAVLATDVDEQAARETAGELGAGAWARALDVRDPEAHRAAAAEASERGRLAVWVNNAGVLRTEPAWEHPDADVRLVVEADLLGVIWGSRAAIDAMRRAPTDDMHLINIASLAAISPAPGLSVYAGAKHGVLGFTKSLHGDLQLAGLPITCHAVCPDAADTGMVRERHEADAAIIWSAPRMLSAGEVADEVVALLGSRKLVVAIPRWRGWAMRATAAAPRPAAKLAGPLRRMGERKRQRSSGL